MAPDNRFDERILRNEVIYLHSLWHQGPPQSPNSNPIPSSNSNRSRILHFINPTTSFKKKAKSRTRPDPGIEWPVDEISQALPSSGWGEFKSKPNRPTQPLSAEEQARLNSLRMQQRVLETCRGFFVNEESDGDEGDEDDVVDGDGIEGNEEYKFLVGIFREDKELRSYYECHHEKGDFFCLVCCGIGNKAPKKFKGCVALVQHSNSIYKTKQTRAHKAFCQVVCKVLGIDTSRLPVFVFNGEPLGRSLGNSQENQCNVYEGDMGSFTNLKANNEESVEKTSLPVASGEVQVMVCENVNDSHDSQLVHKEAFVADQRDDEVMADEDNGGDVVMYGEADNKGDQSQSDDKEVRCADQENSTPKLFESMTNNMGSPSVHKAACVADQENDKLMAHEGNGGDVVMHNQKTTNDNKDGQSASYNKEVCCAGEENSASKLFEGDVSGTMASWDASTKSVVAQPDLLEANDAQQKLIVLKEMEKCNLNEG